MYGKQVLVYGVLSAIQKKTVRHTDSIAYHTYGNVWSIESLVSLVALIIVGSTQQATGLQRVW